MSNSVTNCKKGCVSIVKGRNLLHHHELKKWNYRNRGRELPRFAKPRLKSWKSASSHFFFLSPFPFFVFHPLLSMVTIPATVPLWRSASGLGNQQLGNRKLQSLQFQSLPPLHFPSLWNTVSSSVPLPILSLLHFQPGCHSHRLKMLSESDFECLIPIV